MNSLTHSQVLKIRCWAYYISPLYILVVIFSLSGCYQSSPRTQYEPVAASAQVSARIISAQKIAEEKGETIFGPKSRTGVKIEISISGGISSSQIFEVGNSDLTFARTDIPVGTLRGSAPGSLWTPNGHGLPIEWIVSIFFKPGANVSNDSVQVHVKGRYEDPIIPWENAMEETLCLSWVPTSEQPYEGYVRYQLAK